MELKRRLGYGVVAVGVAVALLTLTVGGSTARACPGLDGPVYETIGVDPGSAAVTGFEVTTATIEWHDGCNRRTNSLVPLLVGASIAVAGLVVARRH